MATLSSKIVSSRGITAINNLYVEVWVRDIKQDFLLGAAISNAEGNFSIAYDDRDLATGPRGTDHQVYLKVYQGEQLIINTIENPVAIIRNTIPDVTLGQNGERGLATCFVKGLILTPKGRGIPNLMVRAYNKTTRTELFLSEGKTNNKGEYLLHYTQTENHSRNNQNNVD